MRILFVTDLHGTKWKYDRLLKIARQFRAKAIINGGDMLPKSGDLLDQGKFIFSYLDHHFARFDAAGIYYLCCLGNDDLRIFDDLFNTTCAKYSHVVNLAQRKFKAGKFEFIGLNWVVDYPFCLKDRCRMDTKEYTFQEQSGSALLSTPQGWQELDDWFAYAKNLPTIADELSRLVRPVNMAQTTYVIHMPPCKLGLDKCGNNSEVGSRAIYEFLLQNQPRLSLHGHIHESPEVSGKWYQALANTVCIQPGQLTPLTYVSGDLDTMEFNRHKDYY